MSVRRGMARGAAVGVLLTGLAAVGLTVSVVTAPPALAAEDSVRLKLASSFRAGGSPGSASFAIAKRTEGCVSPRVALGIQLPGITLDQVTVETAVAGGGWRRVAVSSGGADLVVTQRIRPERPSLCKGKSTTIRYRLTFGAAAPNGTALVVAEAYAGGGTVIGRDSGTARIRGGRPAAAVTLPAVIPTSAPPTPEATEEVPESQETEVVAVAPSRTGAVAPNAADSGGKGFFGLGTVLVMLGVGMVGIGAALLALLIRRGRAERPDSAPPPASAGTAGGVYGRRVTSAGLGAGAEPTAYLSFARSPGLSGEPTQPVQPGPSGLGATGAHPSAGRRVDPTLILPASVPPRASTDPTRPAPPAQPQPAQPQPAQPTQAMYPVAPTNPDATLILPTERSPRPRPGDQPQR